jgi:hypothetical protein
MRLIQLAGPTGRRIAVVEEPRLRLLETCRSIYELAMKCIEADVSLASGVEGRLSSESLEYDAIYDGKSEWRILPAADHPDEPARCLVTGTGLTHMASAKNRQAMHGAEHELTDSMRMYRWGVEGGRPEPGHIGVAPEWFYKGTGAILRSHNEPLMVPEYAEDGGEEPEIAGVYLIDASGSPRRIGFAVGNEFSDHVIERKNYLYLAASKLRSCAVGPELVNHTDFDKVPGEVSIERKGAGLWSRPIHTGEAVMSHTLANLEHHHFKYEWHRRPGDVHIHFFGADAFSFGEGVCLEHGDVMQVRFDGFGRALRNPLQRAAAPGTLVSVRPL